MQNTQPTSRFNLEEERLKELYSYDILDTDPEKEFDELVNLASQICGCPIAAITFIDKERQWFKAKKGDSTPETAKEISFCAHTILQDEPLIVTDATTDQRFAANPDVTGGLNIRFYAGVPIYSARKKRLGAVCVIDNQERTISDAQVAALRLISRQVTSLMEKRRINNILKAHSAPALQKSEASFATFFNQSALPMWIYELETLKFLQVNDPVIKKYGYIREEFLSMSVFDIRTEKERRNIHQLVKSVRNNDKPHSFNSVHQTKDGKILHVQVSIADTVYLGKSARIATIMDITEKEQLKEELKLARENAKEEVQEHIGKELHDNVNQILAGVKLFLDVAENQADLSKEMIRLSKENLQQAIDEIRMLSHSLVSRDEQEFSWNESMEDLMNTYTLTGALTIHIDGQDEVEMLPDDLKLNLFRIIQEQLNNISKYAQASEVRIKIVVDDPLCLTIEDNGKGFDVTEKSRGIGLENVQKRAAFYKGNSQIISDPGKGTCLKVKIPLTGVEMAV